MILNIYVNRDYFLCTALFFSLKSKNTTCIPLHVFVLTISLSSPVGVVWTPTERHGLLMCCVIIPLMVGRLSRRRTSNFM